MYLIILVPGVSSPFRYSLGFRGFFLFFLDFLAPHLSKTITSSPILINAPQLHEARLGSLQARRRALTFNKIEDRYCTNKICYVLDNWSFIQRTILYDGYQRQIRNSYSCVRFYWNFCNLIFQSLSSIADSNFYKSVVFYYCYWFILIYLFFKLLLLKLLLQHVVLVYLT